MGRFLHLRFALILVVFAAVCVHAARQTAQTTHHIEIAGNEPWTDTGLDVHPGQTLTITATGSLHYMDGTAPGPDGLPRTWKDLLRSLPVNSAGRGALIGRIGSGDAVQAFLVGAKLQLPVPVTGRLFLGINGPPGDSAEGDFQVTIKVASPPPAAAANPATSNNPANKAPSAGAAALPPDLFAKIPRRVTDKNGNAGDMVNSLLIGSEEQMKAAFRAAGWVQVDRDTGTAVLEALLASLSKQAYLTMPMSQIYLFGRPQDYGFAHAEPLTVVTTRHHLRLWKSPLTVAGEPVWVGAATHDMGIERDQRNDGLTHHIDPNVDAEGHSSAKA